VWASVCSVGCPGWSIAALVYDPPRRTQVTESGAERKRDNDRAPRPFPPWRPHQSPLPHKRLQACARRAGLVLIADDTADTRELYALYLRHCGYSVEFANDGVSAVEAARRLRPDVIVMDLAMPRADGATATRGLKADWQTRNIPIILLTGYPQRAIERGVIEAGADVFLTKPCLPEDLEKHVRRLLDRMN
jgi:two-component system, cell cycle response regulator DivK